MGKTIWEEGWRVFATCQRPTEAVEPNDLAVFRKNITVHRLDVIKTDGVNALAFELMKKPIDVLINNAGVYLEKYYEVGLGKIKYDDWQYTFKINAQGPVSVIEAFRDHVARITRRLFVVVSTHMASITDIATPGAYYYRSTKAALNAVMEGLTHELKQKDVWVLILHLGWVRTRMGGEGTNLMPRESVRGMRKLVEEFKGEYSGQFFRYDGIEMSC